MKRKGFTLIELLAVLVVLAILALISIPITIRIINESRENSYKRSIESYGRAVESYIGKYLIEHDVDYKTIKLEDIKDEIEYSGNDVTCNSLSFQDNGDIVLKGCHVNNSKIYKYINRNVVEDKYEVGDLITVNGIDFYVISESGSEKDYVTALKAEPLTSNEVSHYGVGHVNVYYGNGEVYDNGKYGGMAYYTSETCGHVNGSTVLSGCKNDYDSSEVKYVVDNWSGETFPNQELISVDGYSARLIKLSELEQLGYVYDSNYKRYQFNSSVPNWVTNLKYTYWTMSFTDTTFVWRVLNKCVNSYCGSVEYTSILGFSNTVRPVINVYKKKIDS